MSTDPVRRANLAAIACDSRPQLPDGFRRSSTRVGTLFGAARTGLSVYELPPGQAVGPYHYENPDEEWLLVVSGTPTLRHPGGEDQLEPWDLVFFPSGPDGAHLVRNTGESTARVAMFSSMSALVGAVVYPGQREWSGFGQPTTQSTWSSNEAAPWTMQRHGPPAKLKPQARRRRRSSV